MSTPSTNPSSNLRTQMRHRDKEMVPRVLVIAMFSLMFASVALVSYAQLTDRPNVGVVKHSPIVESMEITLTGDRSSTYAVTDASGAQLAHSSGDQMGFIGVIGKAVDRERMLHGVVGNPPITVARRENGKFAIIDPSTEMVVDLIGYGADNIAAFATLLETRGN